MLGLRVGYPGIKWWYGHSVVLGSRGLSPFAARKRIFRRVRVRHREGAPDSTAELLCLDTELADANRHFEFAEAQEIAGIDTIGGYVFAVLEHPPQVGDVVRIGLRHEAQVLEVEQFRVRRLLIRSPPEPATETETEKL